jgi:hypothetical protein
MGKNAGVRKRFGSVFKIIGKKSPGQSLGSIVDRDTGHMRKRMTLFDTYEARPTVAPAMTPEKIAQRARMLKGQLTGRANPLRRRG